MNSLFNMLSNVDKVVIALIIVAIAFTISMLFTLVISLKMNALK